MKNKRKCLRDIPSAVTSNVSYGSCSKKIMALKKVFQVLNKSLVAIRA